jgi:hypothetical protein
VNIFVSNTPVTYPILMYGGQGGILMDYNCTYDYFFVIDGDGIIRWRGNWDETSITREIDGAIADLGTAAIDDVPGSGHRLLANYPNPFNPATRIPYELAAGAGSATVQLEILDLRGRLIKTLVQTDQIAGQRYEVTWDGTDAGGRQMPSGTYLSLLKIDGAAQSRFLTLVK